MSSTRHSGRPPRGVPVWRGLAILGAVLLLAPFALADEQDPFTAALTLEEGVDSFEITPAGLFRAEEDLADDQIPSADSLPGGAALGPCPAPVSGCPNCPNSHCFRGADHLGDCWRRHVGDGRCAEGLVTAPVLAVHGSLESLCLMHHLWHDAIDDSWIMDRQRYVAERAHPVWGALQCSFVNWRLSSMFLHGCMPEGYDLFWFAQTSNQALFFLPPQSPGPQEPGGNARDAELIDGVEARPITAVSLNIAPPAGELPPDRAETRFAIAGTRTHLPGTYRTQCSTDFYWHASLLNHQPLYFEDVNLERHGFSWGLLQPAVSAAKFFGTIPALPYLMCAQPPQTTRYTLGESRPGSQAPYVHERPPLNLDAAAFQAAVIVGLVFVIP
jgi:hypothetical protein